MAKKSISSGKALEKLNTLIERTKIPS